MSEQNGASGNVAGAASAADLESSGKGKGKAVAEDVSMGGGELSESSDEESGAEVVRFVYFSLLHRLARHCYID